MTPAQLALIHSAAFTTQRPWSATEFAGLLDDPTTRLLEHEQGFVLLRLLPPEAEILTLAVLPEARRRGVARALVAEAETLATDQKATQLFLEVARSNQPARALYAATGFTETGRRPGYYRLSNGAQDDALLLSRDLSA